MSNYTYHFPYANHVAKAKSNEQVQAAALALALETLIEVVGPAELDTAANLIDEARRCLGQYMTGQNAVHCAAMDKLNGSGDVFDWAGRFIG